ncbi:sigma-54-dependent transcriptional regulator [Dinghuibacter silviterrae]|uniref:Two-component system response regulator HydG n=1 Tax=Dinghuibacter silviterrae TaxID=1539049 RepID=A0A4R8DQB9_9BACT|nr:sigma-54 dependent transcriptional regulator [Dinghuibacter silviterrae]TDW99496.1 two-component system response regulator HydG [Dinghuibacter silviterrae]
MLKILVADDDRDMCLLLQRFLSRNGFEVQTLHTGKKTIEWLQGNKPDLILCDFRLEDMNGDELLKKAKELHYEVPFIIITGYSDVKAAVDVMKHGAFDYITKPLFPDEILLTIKKALAEKNIQTPAPVRENTETAAPTPTALGSEYIHGNTAEFRNILKQIDLVAPTNYSVVIYGESGSGKEVIAREIHARSRRSAQPFVAIDCGAMSKELAGSEMFGHEKGSFTGALNQKTGSFELANGGTIFLDEIANLSYDIQVSLLRVVQERKMRRVGGVKDIDLDVRIIVASNEKLWDAAHKGKFREDLFHRFNEFSIAVPPLRDRKGDILLFARHFLEITNGELGKNVRGFSPEVEDIFLNYVWFGNLRELKNVVKRATLLTEGERVEVSSLPFEITHFEKLRFDQGSESKDAVDPLPPVMTEPKKEKEFKSLKTASLDAEYEMVLKALEEVDFNKSKAAKLLNIDRKTIYNILNQYKKIKQL